MSRWCGHIGQGRGAGAAAAKVEALAREEAEPTAPL